MDKNVPFEKVQPQWQLLYLFSESVGAKGVQSLGQTSLGDLLTKKKYILLHLFLVYRFLNANITHNACPKAKMIKAKLWFMWIYCL